MKDGELLYQTAIVNLTERKRFEEKLQRSEERYRTLFDLVPVAVYTCDANGAIREYNRRAVELWGHEPGQNGEKPRFCGSYKI
jgi:PAS domain-containing protein